MADILSKVSGQFTTSLVLGTFFPVVVFVVLMQLVVVPLFPSDWLFLSSLQTLSDQWKLLALTFLAVTLSGVLYNLNSPITRLYEGYPWQESWIGGVRKRRYQRRFDALDARRKGWNTLLTVLERQQQELQKALKDDAAAPVHRKAEMQAELARLKKQRALIYTRWATINIQVNNDWPGRRGLVLPTRLGNVVRSFEYYPEREYGMDAVTLWPRLSAKIDASYASAVGDAKVSFNFMLNASVLSAILALGVFVVGLIHPTRIVSVQAYTLWVPWVVAWSGFALLAYIFYLGAITQARAWGAMVKSCYDLYRADLLEELGYTRQDLTREQERTLWKNISLQMIVGDRSPNQPWTAYKPASPLPVPRVEAAPATGTLVITRGVERATDDGTSTVVIRVRNTGSRTVLVNRVIDALPDHHDYEWGSERSSDGSVMIEGTNPYTFTIMNPYTFDTGQAVLPGGEVTVRYKAVRRRHVHEALPH